MNAIQIAKDTATKIMENPKHVFINEICVKELAHKIETTTFTWDDPKIPMIENPQILMLYELIAGSVNYNYWYGKPDMRPNGSCSTKMYELLDKSFNEVMLTGGSKLTGSKLTDSYCRSIIAIFLKQLTINRFPMLFERANHLKELVELACESYEFNTKATLFVQYSTDKVGLEDFMDLLITYFPGYANDIFLKRASLFFMMLYRRRGWFQDEIYKLPIPVDYHIPKMLAYFGCTEYSRELFNNIKEYKLIPEGSLMECELRAASLVVANMITKEAPVNTVQVDDYLFLNRKICNDPFHLTITTNY